MWILLTAAFAGELDCRRCCDAAGVGECEVDLRVFGPESKLGRDRGGTRVDGVYVVACDGRGWFDNSRVVYLLEEPVDGQLVMPESEPAAVDCFARSCALPRDLVLSGPDAAGNRRLTSSVTGVAPDRMAYRRAPGTSTATTTAPTAPPRVPPATAGATTVSGSSATVVILEGQTIYAQRASPTPSGAPVAVGSPATPVATPPVSTVAGPGLPTGTPTVAVAAPLPSPTPVATPPVATSVATSPAAAPTATDPFAAGLPADPPAECYASDGARATAARAQVMAGDDKRIARDHVGAVAAYRAAVSLDTCSAYGWLGLGQSALALNRPDVAVRTLRNTTRLLPGHYGAWAELGRAYEALQRPVDAHAAYEQALAVRPDLPEANAGWRRTLPR